MIHLFFLSYDFSGAQTYANQLIPYLSARGDVVVYKVHFESDCAEFTVEDVGEFAVSGIGWKFFFPKITSKLLIDRGYADVFIAPPLQIVLEWLKTNEDDCVIFHSNSEDFIYALDKVRKLIDFYIVSTIHFLPKYYSWKELDGYKEELSETKNNNYSQQLEASDRIICVTEFAAESINRNDKVSADKVSVIYNGYSFDELSDGANRGKYGLSDKDIVLLFVGRITADKGIFSLLTAYRNICVKYANVKLIIVGDGNYRLITDFRDECGESLIYMGKQSREVVVELYELADVGIILSKFEQCSYVALEMMSRRLAVIATNIPGLRELFVDGESGLLVDAERVYDDKLLLDIVIDTDMLEGQMARVICDSQLRSKLGRNGYKSWRERFTAERMARQTYNLYRSLMVP